MEKKVNIIFFFFQRPVYVHNHLLLVSSAGNLFKQLAPRPGSVKLSCENGAHVKSLIREECVLFCFFAHIYVLQLPQLFYSTV